MVKAKLISGTIFILAGQLVALLIWWIYDLNYFKQMIVGSLIAFLISYKGKKKDNVA